MSIKIKGVAMKAAVLEGLNQIVIREVPTPKPKQGELLMRVKTCGVCGSDLRIMKSGNKRIQFPQILGHEVSGIVEATGKEVMKFKVGDRICVAADVPCGLCPMCQIGLGNNCATNYAIGYQFPGGFAEFMLINKTTVDFGPVAKIPNNIDFEAAALAEPLACAINGLEIVNMSIGKTVAIYGLGPIGCMMIPLARHMGAVRVIAIQRSQNRLKMAKEWGADIYICTKEQDPVLRCRQENEGKGPDVVITSCGSVKAHEQAIAMVAQRGWVNLFGGLAQGTRNLNISSNTIHYKECFITGSHGSTPRHHRIALDLISAGYIPVKKIVTHRFSLDDIQKAFKTVELRQGMKVTVNP